MNSPAADNAQAGLFRPVQFDHKTIARFWSKVEQRGPDECWLFTRKLNGSGYGAIGVRRQGVRKVLGAHVFSYELHYGPVPPGFYVCHNCPDGDKPACVNPNHLFAATQQHNMQDASQKGTLFGRRCGRGERVHTAKLNPAMVIQLRKEAASGATFEALGPKYNISATQASHIARGKSWRQVNAPSVLSRTTDGEANGAAILDENKVRMIRAHYTGKHGQMTALAKEFGVTRGAIECVVHGKTWKHVH